MNVRRLVFDSPKSRKSKRSLLVHLMGKDLWGPTLLLSSSSENLLQFGSIMQEHRIFGTTGSNGGQVTENLR